MAFKPSWWKPAWMDPSHKPLMMLAGMLSCCHTPRPTTVPMSPRRTAAPNNTINAVTTSPHLDDVSRQRELGTLEAHVHTNS